MKNLRPESEEDVLVEELVDTNKAIVVYNDDVNDFGHVMRCFMQYCGHSLEQAEQCALLIHSTGRYAVKHGTYDDLKPICEALLENHLTAKIEE